MARMSTAVHWARCPSWSSWTSTVRKASMAITFIKNTVRIYPSKEPCKASNGVHHMTSTSYHLKAIFVFLVCAFFLGGKVFAEDEIPPIPVKRGDTFVDLKAFESFLAHNGGEVNTTAAGDLAGMGEVQAVSTLSPDYQIFLLVHDKNGQ